MNWLGGRIRAAFARVPSALPGLADRRHPTGRAAEHVLGEARAHLLEALGHGAITRHFLGSHVDVVVDEIETPLTVPDPEATGREITTTRAWARRMTVTSARAPGSSHVVVLHRQAPAARVRPARFPVVLLVGRIDGDTLRRLLGMPDAESHLPHLTHSPDGRIVVNRDHTPDDAGEHCDDLDEILEAITRDPRVAALLHDWVGDAGH